MKIFNKAFFKQIFFGAALSAVAFSPLALVVSNRFIQENKEMDLAMRLIQADLPEAYDFIVNGINEETSTKIESRAGVTETPKTIFVAAPLPAIQFKDNGAVARNTLDQYLQMIRGFERTGFTTADIKTMQDGILYISISIVMGSATPDTYSKQFNDAVAQFTQPDNLKKIVDKKNGIGKLTAQDTIRFRKPEAIMDVFTAGALSQTEANAMNKPVGEFHDGTDIFTWGSAVPYDENDQTSQAMYKNAIHRYANNDRFSNGNQIDMSKNNNYMNNFMFKFASLDTKLLKDSEYFALSIEDAADLDANGIEGTQGNAKELELVFANNDDYLVENFGATGKFRTLSDLVKSDMVFIRDMSANESSAFDLGNSPSVNHASPTYGQILWADNIYLSRSESTSSAIDMYFKVKPYHKSQAMGGGANSYFEISVAPSSKLSEFASKFEFGILDHSYAQPIVSAIGAHTTGFLQPIDRWTANNNMYSRLTGLEPLNDDNRYIKNQDPQWIMSTFNYSAATGYQAPVDASNWDYFPRTWTGFNNFAFINNPLAPGTILPNADYATWRIYHSLSNWRTITGSDVGNIIPNETGDLEQIRFFMHPGTSLEVQMQLKKKDGTFIEKEWFTGGSNTLRASFDISGSQPEVSPREYVIEESVFDNILDGPPKDQVAGIRAWDGMSISGSSQREQFAKLDLIFKKGQVMINPDSGDSNNSERIFSTLDHGGPRTLAYQRVFFTPPRAIAADDKITGLDKIKFGSKSKNDTKYETIVSNIYGIWSGYRDEGSDFIEVKYMLDPETYNWYENHPNSPEYIDGTLYSFDYESYSYDDKFGLVSKGPRTEIIEEDANGNDIMINGQPKVLPSNGYNITYKLGDYSSKLIRWSKEVLGADLGDKKEDYYKISNFAGATTFYKDKIENETIVYGPKIMEVAKVMYKYWKNQNLSSAESVLLAEINDLAQAKGVNFNVVGADVEGLGDGKNGPSTDDPEDPYLRSLAIIYEVVSWYWADALIYLINYEDDSFSSIKGSVLSKYMGAYLSTRDPNGIKISSSILERVPAELINAGQEGISLLTKGVQATELAATGAAELQSLLDFIEINGLHDKYLTPENAKIFEDNYDILTNSDTYLSPDKIALARKLIRLLDVIIREIIGETEIDSLTDIINKILDGTIDVNDSPEKPVEEIRRTIRGAIRLITDEKTKSFNYSYFGISEKTNYIENIIVGHNISSAIKKYIEINEAELTEAEIENLLMYAGKEAYTTELITKVAINLKYYNLRLFLDNMLDRNKVSSMVDEILASKLTDIKDIDIPKTNNLLNTISNPDGIINFVLAFVGIMLIMLSLFSIGTSFKKNVRQKGKSMIITRTIFLAIFMVGLLVAGLGLIPLMA